MTVNVTFPSESAAPVSMVLHLVAVVRSWSSTVRPGIGGGVPHEPPTAGVVSTFTVNVVPAPTR